ncbi:hypothetical protein EQO05_06505 [Methanosarcina sp. MSH10X1]|uniref:hypothetical protein n=1 Tax=Methanosarcina sp. MSH10X1 TaxID=2507075 RepID=UPI000FFB9746|nr:hypothetical protein [Methanosarcina sp. MSH10X1]RXA20226.1 hypothetical protein EQO05_06505 [Methanosarcina sp. MSH10X1]
MPEPTPEETQAIELFRSIRNILRVPFRKDLQDTDGQFPGDNQWKLPEPDKKALEDLPGPCNVTPPGLARFQFQENQVNETSTKETSEDSSSKETGGE